MTFWLQRYVLPPPPSPTLREPGWPSSKPPGSGVAAGRSEGTLERDLFQERSEEKKQENPRGKINSRVEDKVTGEKTSC